MHTFTGAVETLQDAILLFEACRHGYLKRVQRRLNESEKRAFIQPGRVFIWDEEEAQIRRWTDSRVWSPSRRFLERFLTYFEIESKHPSCPSGSADSPVGASSSSSSDAAANGPVVRKKGGLSKRCLSVHTLEGRHLHLVAYYGGKGTNADASDDKEPLVRPHLHPLLAPVAEQIMSSEGFRHYPDLWQAWPAHAAPPMGFSPYLSRQSSLALSTQRYSKHSPRSAAAASQNRNTNGAADHAEVAQSERHVPRSHTFKGTPYQYRPASALAHTQHHQQQQQRQQENQHRQQQVDQPRPNYRVYSGHEQSQPQQQHQHQQQPQSLSQSEQQLQQHQQQQQHYARQSEAYQLYMHYSRSHSPSPSAATELDPRYALPAHVNGGGMQYSPTSEYGSGSPTTFTTLTPPLAHGSSGNGIHAQQQQQAPPTPLSRYGAGNSGVYNGSMLCKPMTFHHLPPQQQHHYETQSQQQQQQRSQMLDSSAARLPRGLGGISVDELLGRRFSPNSSRGSDDEAGSAAARAVENPQGSKSFQESPRRPNPMTMVG
ncbi:hypothetical protein HDU87_004768 [Geranomyces variabilis]|uniref:Uncharacterized protein n=1 Tax=Geranomyces variabilis TaxID=109894 RepID=A0AAD5THS1_9FUNG|nr:hypothetical protein HDU87_004768 [Geranomyces variabilis]